MSSLRRINIFIELEIKLNKEIEIFPQRVFMDKLTMTFSTEKDELLFELVIIRKYFLKSMYFKNISIGKIHVFILDTRVSNLKFFH